ncbi:MAG: RNA polymerase factor sigma-32 [Deltaproteobacteria bacterium]|jgi:RNA polymerase sigma-32 factor|nr:RNA polymerase factor sigma-32 [Deltaproteobacteria bacterium]
MPTQVMLEASENKLVDPSLVPVVRPLAPVPSGRPQALPPVPRPKALPPSAPSTDSFKAYLAEVRRFKLLDRQEEEQLIKSYKRTGDHEAGQRLVTANLRLVVKIAMEFQSHWLNNLQDLIQEGNIGLMQALKKFDPSKGVKFSYYASYWIKAYILKYIMDNWRLVKVGTTQAQRKLFFNLRKEQEKLLREGQEPGLGLVAERLGVSEGEVQEMELRLTAGGEISLDATVGPDSSQTQVSLLPSPEEGVDSFLADAQIRELVSAKLERFRETLSERESIILDRRLLTEDPVTLQELGEEFGVSRERVRQLEERLKKSLADYLLKELPELNLNR